jgi:hypothetical protein
MRDRVRRNWKLVAVAVVAFGTGAILRGLWPPFVLDDPFWRDFWSGPPVAGLFAVVAAAVAFYPAFRSTLIARENAAREQWWKRAEWALGLAGSDSQTDREVANDALVALLSDATETEGKMIYRTIANLQAGENIDSTPEPAENRRRRFFPWLK